MYNESWSRFEQTGRIEDYLVYKQEVHEQFKVCEAREKTGEIRELGYAGICNCDRYHN